VIVGIISIATILLGCLFYLRHKFNARLDSIERLIRRDDTIAARQSSLPPEVLALAQRMKARSDIASGAVEFRQSGVMWLSPKAKPTKFTARQTTGVGTPAFVWRAALGPAGVIVVADYFSQGNGGMEVKLLGAMTLARIVGDSRVNQGEILRYLAELPWNPDAILHNTFLDWTVVDAHTMKVAYGVGEDRGEITFNLNANGLIDKMSAPSRLYADKGRMVPLPWHGRFWDYQDIGGRLLPVQGEVAWMMEGVEFVYWRGRLLSWRT